MFVLAWWLIYRAAPHERLFALLAFVAGCVFFPGYVHLFHIYGIFYVPVVLTLGVLFASMPQVRSRTEKCGLQQSRYCSRYGTRLQQLSS